MTLSELKQEVGKYMYMEDTGMIDVALASIIANRLGVCKPVWLVLIGAPSSGKSQILRPLALSDEKFMHQIDDLTENTFLSGKGAKKDEDGNIVGETSLLLKIGARGMLVMSDLTVLFSKTAESREAILSQFRMIYDGRMTKHTGNGKGLEWKGALGVLAGSTPSLYRHFEEVADMGERFVYYRMKDDSDESDRHAMETADARVLDGASLDAVLGGLYTEYLKGVVGGHGEIVGDDVVLADWIKNRLMDIAGLMEKVRAPVALDWRGMDVERLPVRARSVRTYLQLRGLALGLQIMCRSEGKEIGEDEIRAVEWVGYSLANEEKRGVLKILSSVGDWEVSMSTGHVADRLGLGTDRTRVILQNLAAVGVIYRAGTAGGGGGLLWRLADKKYWELVRRVEGIVGGVSVDERETSVEDGQEMLLNIDKDFETFGE